jgi:hypothetical protein
LVAWLLGFSVAPNELRVTTYIVRRIVLQIWQVSDSITISTNTHLIRTLTCAVSTSWADATNVPLIRVNICDIVKYDLFQLKLCVKMVQYLVWVAMWAIFLEHILYIWVFCVWTNKIHKKNHTCSFNYVSSLYKILSLNSL